MPFFQDLIHVPDGMQSAAWLLRPIRESDAELDHEAVMESREFLRSWEQSSWPEDNFTIDANREDLRKMETRHATKESFSYTMVNLSGTQCLGCVYVFPIDATMIARAEKSAIDGAKWTDYAAAVYFWVRKSKLMDNLDRQLLNELGAWFERNWNLKNVLVVTNEQFEQQVAMIETAGLSFKFRINDPKAEGDFLAYELGKTE